MNKLNISLILFSLIITFSSCSDDDPQTTDFSYHAHIHEPTTADKHVGDVLAIEIEYESHTGEPVHHINVKIYSVADGTVVYDKPDEAHVHATDGTYVYEDDFVLSYANGVTEHTDWILEARVWGDGKGLGEVVENVQFHVHP